MEQTINPFPLYCLPSVGFISKLSATPNAEILLGERFEKQTYRSRFEIAGPQGCQLLSIPLVHKSTHASMAEVQIDYSQNWNVKHWRSIETAYRRAPFFEFYAHYFEPLFTKKYFLLAELNLEAIHIIVKILKLKISVELNTDYKETLKPSNFESYLDYNQVFIEKIGFLPNLSILDLIFNEGPTSKDFL
jgi:hypothetical protein